MSNKLKIFGNDRKKVQFYHSAEKGHAEKNQGLQHREGGRWK